MKLKFETSAGGIVYKKQGKNVVWLVTQHSEHKGWGFPKGLIGDKEKNEPMDQAALREVEEEGGVEAKIITELPQPAKYMYRFKDALVKKTVYYFLMEYLTGDPKNHDWEVSDAKFLNENEVKKILTYKTDKDAFSQALSVFDSLSTRGKS